MHWVSQRLPRALCHPCWRLEALLWCASVPQMLLGFVVRERILPMWQYLDVGTLLPVEEAQWAFISCNSIHAAPQTATCHVVQEGSEDHMCIRHLGTQQLEATCTGVHGMTSQNACRLYRLRLYSVGGPAVCADSRCRQQKQQLPCTAGRSVEVIACTELSLQHWLRGSNVVGCLSG